ncbi:hypothetical protein jhhlp_008293 [Lomentospora prolificans]|uniref:AMP-dependent synthetase/ligase domain-containing protein n=1 Tax=Lomentospora prolificans TaxID=41688 RepID=A0A2N3MXM8_9PEZI|nr:hypothetical protein jhhlp_008293 [Lomentospora prolificans]
MAKQLAISGNNPKNFPEHNIFEFLTSDPFKKECDFVPAAHTLAPIEPSRPIFVDHKSVNPSRPHPHPRPTQERLARPCRRTPVPRPQPQRRPRPSRDVYLPPPRGRPRRPDTSPQLLSFPTLALGTFASGLTATLVSPALTSEEISWILQNARPKVIITSTGSLKAMKDAIAAQKDTTYFSKVPVFTVDVANETYPLPAAKSSSPSSTERDWTELLTLGKPLARAVNYSSEIARNRTAVILWSSGTSGRSKGVLLSHNALNFSIGSIWHDADYFRGQRQQWLGYVPFYHVFGLCNILLISVCIGATVHVMQSFHLETVLQAVPKHKITYFHMAPPVAVMLAKAAIVDKYAKRDAAGKNAFDSVVAGVTGGAPLGHEVVVEVYKRLGFRVRLGYGLSEACSTTLQRGLGEADMHAQAGDSGKPHWGVQVMIAAKDETYQTATTRPGVVGEDGEILIRCPALMTAYLPIGGLSPGAEPDMSITNEALTKDGWFRTGDVGILSADGRLRITDRLKELIKVRAFQVAPAELEAILCSSEDVADAGVVGIYDNNEATEWPRAFVVPRKQAGEKELEDLAQKLAKLVEARTAKYKWLQGGIVFVEAIPKSPSGKILRRIMKNGGVKGFEVQIYQRKKRATKL